jgi:hypothetical protein
MLRATKAGHFIINGRDYFFNFVITWEGKNYHYRLILEEQANLLADFLPRDLHFDEINGVVQYDERLQTDEGKKIAETIWEGIKAGVLT